MYDETWLTRLQIDTTYSDPTGRQRLVDIASGQHWLCLATRWCAAETVRQFEHEYALGQNVHGDAIERPVALIRAQDGPVLIFDDIGARPVAGMDHPLSPLRWLDLALGAARALSQLHAADIVHCAIDTDSVRVRPDGQIIISGLGRSVRAGNPQAVPLAASDQSLPYASPELADRTNPRADFRSDLYSLGATLYQLLTGQPLFDVRTPAQWLHAHVAMTPLRPSSLCPTIPAQIDSIVLRLLAKDPVDRYASAEALCTDLTMCRTMLFETGAIAPFALSGLSRIPLQSTSNVVGRNAELRALREAAHRVETRGQPEFVVLSGAAGAGKSSLVEHVCAALPRWATLGGKCDQSQREAPYLPLTQAIAVVVERFANHDAQQAEAIRKRLHDQLDGKGGLISELVPGFAKILSDQPAVQDLPADQALARLNATLAKVVSITAEPPAPTLLFIDDVQWADDSTWSFLHHLARFPFSHLLVVLTVRNNTDLAERQVEKLTDTLHEAKTRLTAIDLPALDAAGTTGLVDAMLTQVSNKARFVAIIAERTLGNPYFTTQLIEALTAEGILRFDAVSQRWTWDEPALIRHVGYDDCDLIKRRISALAPETLDLIRSLACIGPRAQTGLLALAMECDAENIAQKAAAAVSGGLLLNAGERISFAHDTIYETAYAMTPCAERARSHARTARLMLAMQHTLEPEGVFDIARHIGLALPDGLSNTDTVPFVEILIHAARRAKGAAAVEQAQRYLDTGEILLARAPRESGLRREAQLVRCDCLIAQGDLDAASKIIDALLKQSVTPLAKAEVYRLRASLQTLRSDYEGTVEAALEGLAHLDINLVRHPAQATLRSAYEDVLRARGDKQIADMVSLPLATNRHTEVTMSLLATLIASSFTDDGLSFIHTAKMVVLSLEAGVTPFSTHGFAWFGVFIAHHFGEFAQGGEYAQVAMMLSERHGWQASRANTLVAADQVCAWTRPMNYALSLAQEARRLALGGDDWAFACYASNHIVSDLLFMGAPLRNVINEANAGIALSRQIGFRDIERLIASQHSLATRFEGGYAKARETRNHSRADTFSELGLPTVSQTTLFFEWLYAGIEAYHFDDGEAAEAYFVNAAALTWSVPAHVSLCDLYLYRSLNLLNQTPRPSPDCNHRAWIEECRGRLARLARSNPQTFRGRHLLLEAELAREAGRGLEAFQIYEQAIAATVETDFVNLLGLIHERAAAHAANSGLDSTALHFAQSARNAYLRWGATALAIRLEQSYPLVALDREQGRRNATVQQDQLDAAVALEAAKALSGEIGLEQVIEKLMRAMIVHSGARHGVLLVPRGDTIFVEATGSVIGDDVIVDVQSKAAVEENLPMTFIERAVEHMTPQVLENGTPGQVRPGETKAMIALPLIKQNRTNAVLYLENDLTAQVFNPQRVAILELLAPLAANALDAATAYAELVVEHKRRMETDQALQNARTELARNSRLITMGSLAASIAHEINNPLASISGQASAGVRWLSRPEPNLDEAIKCLNAAKSGSERAVEIVRELRALAKQTPSRIEPLELDELIRTVLALTSADIGAKNIATDIDLRDGLIRGNAVQLQQVIVNLIANALDAMGQCAPPAGGHVLTIRSRTEDAAVTVHIEDTGPGIGEHAITRIFDPFFTTKETGMGMGLAICRSIIETHEGTLNVRNLSPTGTGFVFRIPRAG